MWFNMVSNWFSLPRQEELMANSTVHSVTNIIFTNNYYICKVSSTIYFQEHVDLMLYQLHIIVHVHATYMYLTVYCIVCIV